MTSISKDVYIDKLGNIVNEYNNTFHSTIKMESASLKASMYIVFGVKNIDKESEFEVGNHIRISKHKKHLCKRLHSKVV